MDPQDPPSSSHGQAQQQRQQPVYDTNHGGHYGLLRNHFLETFDFD